MTERNRRVGVNNLAADLKTDLRSTFVVPYAEVDKKKNDLDDSQNDKEDSFHNVELELIKGVNKKNYIMSLFPRKLFAELYFAWCKDCCETISIENAKYFRDELSMRDNKDSRSFNFRSLRVSRNFLTAFVGNLEGQIKRLDLSDNVVSDLCMHNIKNIISVKKIKYLNLCSNMISTEGLKIVQSDLMNSENLKYLNFGVVEGSFRRNNFSGDGGIVIARILLANTSINTLILQDNELGEDSAEKIGASLIQNKTMQKLKISENKIKNKGANSILENGSNLVSINLSENEITPEVCLEIKKLLEVSINLQELNWDSNNIGVKGISYIVEGLNKSKFLKYLSIKNTNIGDSGLKILAYGLRSNKYLDTLDISSNSITYDSFVDICDSLTTNQIACLKMKNNLLGDESMEYFANTILAIDHSSRLNYFDFSSCKVYDQGLIYIISKLVENTKIKKIKMRDNYFTHEIDYVLLDFIEKSSNLVLFDVKKNRFSFQCLQKVEKIIERNKKIQSDKEPNKLLIEIYRLKYENTKLNEMKECLKFLEKDVEKLKLNRAELRQDYESCKIKCDDKYDEINQTNEKIKKLLKFKNVECEDKITLIDKIQNDYENADENLSKQIVELKDKKEILEEENKNIKINTENIVKEYIVIIEKINNRIDENNKKEFEHNKNAKDLMEQIMKIDKLIQSKSLAAKTTTGK